MATVVLLAGGLGKRVGKEIAKQHIIIQEHQIIEYTLLAFSKSDLVDRVLVVSHPDYINDVLALKTGFPKLTDVIPGGDTRIQSVKNSIQTLKTFCCDNEKVIISDAARPCITTREINEMVDALDDYKAVTSGIDCYETILQTNDNRIKQIIARDGLVRQTSPEGYIFAVLKWLYLDAGEEIIQSYKNIGIDQLYASGLEIGIIKSNPLNFKITTDEDLRLFDSVLKQGFERVIGL